MKRKTKHSMKVCPAKDCSGGNAGRQNNLTEGQTKLLPAEMQTKIQEREANRCSYCGCVYIRNYGSQLDTHTILGFLDNGILGEGWHKYGA